MTDIVVNDNNNIESKGSTHEAVLNQKMPPTPETFIVKRPKAQSVIIDYKASSESEGPTPEPDVVKKPRVSSVVVDYQDENQ